MQSLQGKLHLTPRSWVPLGVTLLLLSSSVTLFSPTARAAFIAPVSTFVGVVASAQSYSNPQGAFSSQINFTWTISPSDPDQLNGSLNYTFYEQNASIPGGWQCLRGCLSSVGSALPIPGRPGWLYLVVDAAPGGFLFQTANGTQLQFNMTANTPGGFSSDASCTILLAASIVGNQAQCGYPQIQPPPGLAASIIASSSQNGAAYVNITWPSSPSDPQNNSFTYRLTGYQLQQSGSPLLVFNFTAPNASYLGGQNWAYNQTASGPNTLQIQIRAEDTYATHQISNYTCLISIQIDAFNSVQACGLFSTPQTSANGISTTPLFPFMGTSTFANGLGISQDLSNLLLAAILILIIGGVGWYIAGAFGLIFAATLGIVLSGSLGLIPFWLFLFIFTIGAGAFVLAWRSGGNAQ